MNEKIKDKIFLPPVREQDHGWIKDGDYLYEIDNISEQDHEGEYKQRWMWSDLRNCTQFISEEAARSAADKSGLDGFKVLIKVNQFDEYCQAYNNREWLWECLGGI